MTTTTDKQQRLAAALAVRFNLLAAGKQHSRPEDNPYATHTADQMVEGVGLVASHDRHPARNMAAVVAAEADRKRAAAQRKLAKKGFESLTPIEVGDLNRDTEGLTGHLLESERIGANKAGRDSRAARRQVVARRRAQRKQEFDALVSSDVRPDPERMAAAWDVALVMLPAIERMAAGRARWAARHLGSLVEDVPQVVVERVALALAKSDRDLDVMRKAAKSVAKDKTPKTKEVRKARRWLGGMAYNMVMGTLVDLYLSDQNVRWQNLDIIATVMASIGGGEDPLISRFKADRAPSMLGTKFTRPGSVDYDRIAFAVAGAICDHGLDDLADVLLDSEVMRSDGSIAWHKNAERIVMAGPDNGEHIWQLIERATAHMRPKTRKEVVSKAVMHYVRNHFSWLPEVIVGVIAAHDVRVVGYGARPVLRSDFDWDYLAYHRADSDPLGEARWPLAVSLSSVDAADAAAALDEALHYLDGRDVVLASSSL